MKLIFTLQVYHVSDDRRTTADKGKPGKEFLGNCKEDPAWNFQAKGGTRIEWELSCQRSPLQGTALYELYLSIQQRALRAFHDPGTWGGIRE